MDDSEHKEKVKASFDMASQGYDCHELRFFVNSASHLIDILDLKGNENLIDVATGTGHFALAAAQKLTEGTVTGVDISDKMLETAKQKMEKKGLTNVSFHCCDIESIDFEEKSFDVASCAFGLFFLPDMASGLNHISRLVKPGGKVAITSFTGAMMEPLSEALLNRLKKYGIEQSSVSWKRLDTREKIDDLMSEAGLENIDIQSRQMGYHLKDANEWWNLLWNSGYRGLIDQLSPEELPRFKKDHENEINDFADNEGIWLDIEVMYSVSKIKVGR